MLTALRRRVDRYVLNIGPLWTVLNLLVLVYLAYLIAFRFGGGLQVVFLVLMGVGGVLGLVMSPVAKRAPERGAMVLGALRYAMIALVLVMAFGAQLPTAVFAATPVVLGFLWVGGFVLMSDPGVLTSRGQQARIERVERILRSLGPS